MDEVRRGIAIDVAFVRTLIKRTRFAEPEIQAMPLNDAATMGVDGLTAIIHPRGSWTD
jgi:hypothetical protein